jgi:AcrR family transcriptional regulator
MVVENPRIARSRDALITATLSLLDSGAGKVPSVTEVCEKAQTSRPTFYQHFGDLTSLIAAAVERRLDATFSSVVPHPAEQGVDGTYDVIRALLGLIMEDKPLYRGVLEGPAARAAQDRIVSYVVDRLLTVSPFAAQLQAVDGDRVLFLAAGTTQLLLRHLLEDSPATSVEETAGRVADTLVISATALAGAPSHSGWMSPAPTSS